MSDIAALGFEIDSTQARNAAKDLDRLAAAADKTERSAKKLSTASRDLLRDESGRFMSAASAAEKYGAEIDSLRMKYNPLYAASKQFEAQQGELQRALALGAISVAQYDAALEGLQGGMVRSGGAVQQFGKTMAASSHHTTNLMYQFQDIGMMLAAGQNPLMLAVQQGTQVSGVFHEMQKSGQSAFQGIIGGLGALINPTSLLTLGVIAGGAALVQWGMSAAGADEKARTLDDAMSELDAASSGLKSTQDIISMSVDELKTKYGEFAFLVQEVAAGLAQNQIATMNNLLTEQVIAGAEAFDQFAAKMDAATASAQYLAAEEAALQGVMLDGAVALSGAASQTEQSIRNMMGTLGVTREVAIGLADDFARVRNASSMEDRVSAFLAIDRAMAAAGVSASMLPPEINKAMTEAKTLAIKLAEGKTQAQALSDAAPGAGWMGSAISETNMLIGQLIKAKAVADALRSVKMSGLAAQYQQYGEGRVAGENLSRESGALYGGTGNVLSGTGWYDTGSGGVGGGGGTDQYADNLTRLIESLQTERETVDAWYNENLTILNDRRSMEILGEQGHKDAMLDLEREYLEKKKGLNDGYGQFSLDSAGQLFGELYSLSGSKYEGLLKMQKGFAAASALINAYTAASQALADPSLPFFAKFAAVAKVLATGMGLVNAIKGGGSSGGGSSGSASATTSATSAARAEPEKVTRIELIGEDWIVNLVEPMISQIYDASKNGRVIIAKA